MANKIQVIAHDPQEYPDTVVITELWDLNDPKCPFVRIGSGVGYKPGWLTSGDAQ